MTKPSVFPLFLILIISISIPNTTFGTQAGNTAVERLSWEDCIALARKTNPELNSAEINLKAADYTEKGASATFFPQISSSLNHSYGNSGGSSGIQVSGGSEPSITTSASLTATQNIFNGFQDQAKVNQARANRQAILSALSITKAKLSVDLKVAYAGIQYAQNSVGLTSDILKRREANLKLVELRYTSGRENKGAVLLSKAYLEQARYELLQAQNGLTNAQTQMAKVFGREISEDLYVQGSIPELSAVAPIDFRLLASQTPEFIQAQAHEDLAMAQIEISSSGIYPTLSLSGTTGAVGSVWMPSTQRWSIGATLTIPIFNGGKDYYAIKSSAESARAASLNKDSAFHQSILRLKQTWSAYLEIIQKLRVDQAFLEALALREKIAKEKYNNGLMSFEDWDLIENDLISRQKTTIQSQRDRIIAEATWEQAQGHGVFNEKR